MISYILSKVTEIPRKFRKYFYVKWNRLICKINRINYGYNMRIFNSIYIFKHHKAIINIGNNFTFTSGESFNPLCRNIRGCIHASRHAKIIIGNNVGISSACIWAKDNIQIGDNVLIGGDSILIDTDAHNLDYKIRNSSQKNEYGESLDGATANCAPIVIKENVLIGTRCIILKGVTIGKNSIIGAGSVVVKSIPDNCIAAGNPCKKIKDITF